MKLFMYVIVLFFFFSSRRRHTRYWRDWSSDVCSSDLGWPAAEAPAPRDLGLADEGGGRRSGGSGPRSFPRNVFAEAGHDFPHGPGSAEGLEARHDAVIRRLRRRGRNPKPRPRKGGPTSSDFARGWAA